MCYTKSVNFLGNSVNLCYIPYVQKRSVQIRLVFSGPTLMGKCTYIISKGSDTIPNHVNGCQDSGILTFINILAKFCIYSYIINHVICIALFGKQESLESGSWNPSKESRNPAKIPRFRTMSRKSIVPPRVVAT